MGRFPETSFRTSSVPFARGAAFVPLRASVVAGLATEPLPTERPTLNTTPRRKTAAAMRKTFRTGLCFRSRRTRPGPGT